MSTSYFTPYIPKEWIVPTIQTYPEMVYTKKLGMHLPATANYEYGPMRGLRVRTNVPRDIVNPENGDVISFMNSFNALALDGHEISPIICQWNVWAITDYGVESLLWPLSVKFNYKEFDWDFWHSRVKGKTWYDRTWFELQQAIRIAKRLFQKRTYIILRKKEPGRKISRTPMGWLSLRFEIMKRDGYRCRLCGIAARDGAHVRLEVDHITPRVKGINNDPSNLWTLCFECNRGKGKKDL